MAGGSHDISIVDYYAEHERYRCGYCKSVDTNYSHGMWAHTMTVQDYQDLIDRGWRRSGRYCYKPTMDLTCCPMYTIRCLVTDLKLSKSQKKVIKRMNKYISYGDTKTKEEPSGKGLVSTSAEYCDEPMFISKNSTAAENNSGEAVISSVDPTLAGRIGNILTTFTDTIADLAGGSRQASESEKMENAASSTSSTSDASGLKKAVQPGKGGDTNLPPCKKAKFIRLEQKKEKLMKKGLSADDAAKVITENKKPQNTAKSLEDILLEPIPGEPKHNLEHTLMLVGTEEFKNSLDESFMLFKKYQLTIHKDKPEECRKQTFCDFLCSSPLKAWKPANGPSYGYGSFHQQYWLDGRLIAVGVIDILPKCISSVYFYYDPEMGHLSLGTYGSLRELYLTRSIQKNVPELKYYYMGYYIHTCPKMRYKAAYSPSYLLCPETYTWHTVEKCRPKLDVNRYMRFEEDKSVKDPDGDIVISDVLVLHRNRAMPFCVYAVSVREDVEDVHNTHQYAELVGMSCARRMLLVKH